MGAVHTNFNVAAGDVLHIEYLNINNNYSITKFGEGRLEVAIFGNPKTHVNVSNGTFAVVCPTLDLSEDANVVYHVDATASGTQVLVREGGTNFVSQWSDADGRSLVVAKRHGTRPMPFLTDSAGGINGLPAVDFGTLGNDSQGYGGALLWEYADGTSTDVHEYYYAFEDDPGAKDWPANTVGPCIFGLDSNNRYGVAGALVRDFCGGANAGIHPPNVMGRLQSNNYLDGTGVNYTSYKVPDGPHVFWQWTSGASYPVNNAQGFGFCTAGKSYGGFKLGEFIVCNAYFSAARRAVVQRYMKAKWRGTTIDNVTINRGATFDTSALKVNVGNFNCSGGTVTDWDHIVTDHVSAGSACRPVSGTTFALADRSEGGVFNLGFIGAAGLSADEGTTGAVSRVEGTGTFMKTGAGTVLVGSLEGALDSVDVRAGVLRIAPLEAPGVLMRFDATATSSLETYEQDGTNFVGRWSDANGRNVAAVTNSSLSQYDKTYRFDATRAVGRPFLLPAGGPNGLPAVDFGRYTTADHPDGDGAVLVPTDPVAGAGDGYPGVQNVMAVWCDRPEYADLTDIQAVNGVKVELPVVGPSLFGGEAYWQRGLGGHGKIAPLYYGDVPTRLYSGSAPLRIDMTNVISNVRGYLPSHGWHLFDQKVEWRAGTTFYAIGGNWNVQMVHKDWYVNHTDAADNATKVPYRGIGVYGGVRFGEIVVFRRLLTAAYRDVAAKALNAKWFNQKNVLSFNGVSLADGTALETPYTTVCATNVSLAGASRLGGGLLLPDGAAVSVACDGGAASLKVDSVTAVGGGTVAVSAASVAGLAGHSFRLFATDSVTGSFSPSGWKVGGLDGLNLTAALEVKDDGVWINFHGGGTMLIVR